MPPAFDAYHTWLGIPPEEQPPDYYCLLGLRRFEQNLDVIDNAADQRMAHLRTFQTGRRTELSQKLLNEVAAARVCLLNPQRKPAYDRQLRQMLEVDATDSEKTPGSAPPPPPQTPSPHQPSGPARGPAAGVPIDQRRPTPTNAPRRCPVGARSVPDWATDEPTVLGQLGEYQLLEKLGEGGMGAVYKALHTKLGRQVALKVLPKGRIEDPRAIARFEREMMAVGAVDHPNIVRAMDAREIEGTRFLVMEFVKGLDLGKVVRRLGHLPVADACELVRQAALALQSAYEHKLVHRDVKPSNLMLNQQGQVKLLDLGLARFQSDQPAAEEVTATGQPIGTIDYMAPEQVSDTHMVDIRADVYGLGCTLYKLLTGRPPFSGPKFETPFNKMQGHLQKGVPPIRRFRRDVPRELVAVLNRMLAKDPAERFATPVEAADAIGPLATGSDLAGLLARAEGKQADAVRLGEALTATEEAPSASALTRFFQQLKSDSHEPAVEGQVAKQDRRARLAITVGCVAVGVLSVAILIACAIRYGGKSGSGPAVGATELVFDWPPEARQRTTLFINREPYDFPPSGRLVVPCKPGKYRIHAVREGFQPHEKLVTVTVDRRQHVPPFDTWVPQSQIAQPQIILSHAVIRWPEDQRIDTRLEIDGEVRDLKDPTIEATPEHVKVPLEAGPHKLWIARRGLVPFEQQFTVVDGEDLIVDVVWGSSQPRYPVPSQAEQEAAAERIEAKFGPAVAQTADEKAGLARERIRQAKQAEDPAERFVLFQQAMSLAIEAGDAALLLEAAGTMGDRFDLDLSTKKQEAFTEFVRKATPLPEIRSVIQAGEFADTAARSPLIASLAEAIGQAAVGDAYWDLSRIERAEVREALMLCAGHWYRQAPSDATSGPLQEKFRFRRAQIAQVQADLEEARKAAGKDDAYAAALAPAEAMVVAWDFSSAAAALAKLSFPGPELAARRDDVGRMAGLKTRMIAKINAGPPLKKSALSMRGINGDVVKADDKALTARLITGKTESYAWQSLGPKAVEQMVQRVIDLQNADDRLAAGLLLLLVKDATAAEKHFQQARSLDAPVDRYFQILANVAFQQVNDLLDGKEFTQAREKLNNLQEKYGDTPWYASHQGRLEAARERITAGMAGVAESEAEKLYTDAAELFNRGRYFELKPLVLKLKQEFAQTPVATDPNRRPSFADMSAVIDNLGKFITVRRDGKGHFTTIQQAVNSAPPNSLIEIQDNGPYGEEIVIPANKSGLTIRGKTDLWPVVTTAGLKTQPAYVMTVRAERSTIERLILLNAKRPQQCALIEAGSLRARRVIMYAERTCLTGEGQHHCELENCITVGAMHQIDSLVARNCVSLKGGYFGRQLVLSNVVAEWAHATGPAQLQFCTITGPVRFEAQPNTLLDSIVSQVESVKSDTRIESCNVYNHEYLVLAKPGKGCFSQDPKFRDPNGLDFQLAPTSPCLKKASDGGDLGCRYTSQMLKTLEMAFELRRQGIIKF